MNRTDCDVLIVGAGLAGAATAYHLRRMTQGSILLMEQEDLPGVHSSGRNAAMIRQHVEDAAIRPLMQEGAAFLRRGELAEFRQTGSVLLGLGDADVTRWVPPAVGCGQWCPTDGVVDVSGLLHAYLRGQTVRYGARVLGWHSVKAAVEVETSRGLLRCGLLVNAAGPWAGRIGDLPLTPMNRHLFFTPPTAAVDRAWPFVWHLADGFYFRPESGGLLLCTCDETPAEAGDYDLRRAPLETLAELAHRHLPGLGELAIRQVTVGQRTFARDRQFVIGHDPRHSRLFHVAGLGGHGVTASWAVGHLAAQRILEGSTAPDAVFSPAHQLG